MQDQAIGRDGTLDPDASEQELADEMDPAGFPGIRLTRVVGLGGSAGSIPAIQRFFAAMPPHPGMAFVVVLHLPPDAESALSQVLQTSTSLHVGQARDGEKVREDHVYVIPPGKHLSLTDGHLRLTELPRERGRRLTVDLFFRSLADTHGQQSVGIVFSGADGDGALGVKRIKERGGLTISQDPQEAEHPSMPESAIATSMVDWVLGVDDMPRHLLDYHERGARLQLPPEPGPNPALAARPSPSMEESALREVLVFLRTRTGRDFSYYKRATIVRRIARRMQVNEVDDLPAYLSFLRMHPGEAGALLKDLLISVTNFFRDREAFEALEEQIPELFRNKTSSDTVRVWVPACATGEEAYSIAMLLSDYARTLDTPPMLQIFATDLDDEVLVEARNGIYPSSITTDVSPDRLQRYFVKQHHRYRVRRELREMLLFAVHDVLKDSPFSRLDLVSCRNMLIYLNRGAQKRAFEIFHFALRHDGRLFLGTSESADDAGQLFQSVDKKHRIYAMRGHVRTSLPVPTGQSSLARAIATHDVADLATGPARRASHSLPAVVGERPSWGELHLKLIDRFGPPSVLVNGEQEVVHLSESAAPFLHFGGGEPTTNLFRLAHESLRAELRATVFRARQGGQPSAAFGVPTVLGDAPRLVDIRVAPALELAPDLLLVTFELREPTEPTRSPLGTVPNTVAEQLERELDQTKLHVRDLIEQHEASTEELKASNEELQAMNEELRSATEELETSREELQSINEELTTVNSELKSKVDELGQANSDLHNLMGATAIATVFLDRHLRIMRFTPPAVELFNLIPTDLGRPLADLQHLLVYPDLMAHAARVLQQLVPIESEVVDQSGRSFLARLVPYRTTEDRIAGVVLTLVNVTDRQLAQQAVYQAQVDLERRVLERTAQLDQVNVALRREVQHHQQAERARQELQRRLVDAQEQERSRISLELHDEVGQQITALMLALKGLEAELPVEELHRKLRDLRATAENVGREIHQLASELRPVALDQLGLSRALSGYLVAWSERSGITVDFFSAGIEEPRLPDALETTLYRIVQEAMNNIFKHASAKTVSVSVERHGNQVVGIVEDDGGGFDPDAPRVLDLERIGIAGMRERAVIVGGELTIESSDKGTTVRAKLPVPAS